MNFFNTIFFFNFVKKDKNIYNNLFLQNRILYFLKQLNFVIKKLK